MNRYMTTLVICAQMLCFSLKGGHAALVGYWEFEEGKGTVAMDTSGNGLDGTIEGTAEWAMGEVGRALAFNGEDTYIEVIDVEDRLSITGEVSVGSWVYMTVGGSGEMTIIGKGFWGDGYIPYELTIDPSSGGGWWQSVNDDGAHELSYDGLTVGEWVHVAGTFDGQFYRVYVNGVLAAEKEDVTDIPINHLPVTIGKRTNVEQNYVYGLLDEVFIYDHALSEDEILDTMEGLGAKTMARYPQPADGDIDVPRDGTTLQWSPGEFAHTHTVYLSDVFADVNEGRALLSDGLMEPNCVLGRLDLGKTYYWRVDEVNAPPSKTVYPSNVWQFEVEPMGYPIPPDSLTVTVSSQDPSHADPNVLINGTGLDDQGCHSKLRSDMWLSASSATGEAWARIDLTSVQKVYGLQVWNHNTDAETYAGFSLGIKEAKVEYSVDGTTWNDFGMIEIPKAPGSKQYVGSFIELNGLVCQAIKITALSNWSAFPMQQYGLAEVQVLAMPMAVRAMEPIEGSTVNPMNVVLCWRSGRQAGRHELFLSSDREAVVNESVLKVSLTDNSYHPELDMDQTYYWKVNEVNDADVPVVWEGPVQSFKTAASSMVDDMEFYRNKEGMQIWAIWEDGYEIAENGSLVGNGLDGVPETAVVYQGVQSLPMEYGYAGATHSWATRTFDPPQDWGKHGIKSLSLYLHGEPTNEVGTFYVRVNDTRYNYEGTAEDLKAGQWVPFTVNLTDVSAVTSLTLGMDGGYGKIYVDNIRLYSLESEVVTPVTPKATDLLARYPLNGTCDDISPNGLHGTPVGGVAFVNDVVRGQVLQLDGLDACVDLGPAGNPNERFNFAGSFTLCAWVNVTNWYDNWGHVLVGNYGESGKGWQLRRYGDTSNLNFTIRGVTAAEDQQGSVDIASQSGQWFQVTAIYNQEVGLRQVFVNGRRDLEVIDSGIVAATTHNVYIGARATGNNSGPTGFFSGLLDDVRIYQRALSHDEVLSLAGRTSPMYRAFPE